MFQNIAKDLPDENQQMNEEQKSNKKSMKEIVKKSL